MTTRNVTAREIHNELGIEMQSHVSFHSQRRVALHILHIAIGARLQQHRYRLQSIIAQCGPVQHCVVVIVANVRIGAMIKQQTVKRGNNKSDKFTIILKKFNK